jgi:hypothetical protein
MLATNAGVMSSAAFLMRNIMLVHRFLKKPRSTFFLSAFIGSALLLTGSLGCGPPSNDGKQGSSESQSDNVPELTDEVIRERIHETWVREVPSENVNSAPISWGFSRDEPKEIAVVEKNVEGTRATIVLDVKTGSSPRARNQRYLAGQIRTEWELRTGWVLRRWEIVDTENISMKYRDLPKPPATNSNR